MIEQSARVLLIDQDWVVVATEPQSSCSSCDARGGCGTSLVARLFPQRPEQQLRLSLQGIDPRPRPGDRVIVGIDEGYLHRSTLLLYAVPLVGLVGGAVAGSLIASLSASPLAAEPMSILFCLLGLSLGLAYTRKRSLETARDPGQVVRLLRVVDQPARVAIDASAIGGARGD